MIIYLPSMFLRELNIISDGLNSLSSDWCGERCDAVETKFQAGPGVLAFDWPVAGCTSGSWLLPQDTSQELQRSPTGKVVVKLLLLCFLSEIFKTNMPKVRSRAFLHEPTILKVQTAF